MYNLQTPTRHFCKNLVLLPSLLFGCLLIRPVQGTAHELTPPHKQDTTISPQDLKAYEGYYKFQFEQGADSYIHITATPKGLLLHQMWDGKEIAFTPQSALDFVDDDGDFPLKFTKDGNGAITQVLAFNRDLWSRTNDYKPPVTRGVHLDPGQLKTLAGKYTFQFDNGQDAFIEIRATDNGLILKQMWDGKEFSFVALSELDFYCSEARFPLKFTKDKNGTATQVLAFNRDLWNRVKQ